MLPEPVAVTLLVNESLDRLYLRCWVAVFGVADLLERALAEAGWEAAGRVI